jgi:hypothetical protein
LQRSSKFGKAAAGLKVASTGKWSNIRSNATLLPNKALSRISGNANGVKVVASSVLAEAVTGGTFVP